MLDEIFVELSGFIATGVFTGGASGATVSFGGSTVTFPLPGLLGPEPLPEPFEFDPSSVLLPEFPFESSSLGISSEPIDTPADFNKSLYRVFISCPYVVLGAHFPPSELTVGALPLIVTKCLGS